MMKRSLGLLACLLTVTISLLGCTGTTSENTVPLLLEYNNDEQISYVKALWAPEKGTVEIGKEPVLSYPNNDKQVVALHWEGPDSVTVFTREATSNLAQIQTNGVKVNVISLANSLPIYYDPMVAYTTNEAIYAAGVGAAATTISKISATGMQQYQVANGTFLGLGAMDDKIYVLVGKQQPYVPPETGTIPGSATMSIILDVLNPDGTMTVKTVTDNYDASILTLVELDIPFADGCFYLDSLRLDVTSNEPKLVEVTSIAKGLKTVATATKLEPFTFYEETTFPSYTKYKDYLVAVGQTVGPNELTIAAFKNDELAGFALITPYSRLRPIPEQLKTTKVYTYDAHGKQLNSYAINTPDSVVVPMTP